MAVMRNEMSQIDALVYVATQSISTNPHFHLKRKGGAYLLTNGKSKLDIDGLNFLVTKILQANPETDCYLKPIVYRALKCLGQHLQKQMRIGCLQRLWWTITCQTEKQLKILERCKVLNEIVKQFLLILSVNVSGIQKMSKTLMKIKSTQNMMN
jgi:hypothetical protein